MSQMFDRNWKNNKLFKENCLVPDRNTQSGYVRVTSGAREIFTGKIDQSSDLMVQIDETN